jgi:hypothetical protein
MGKRLNRIATSARSSDYCPGGPGIRVNPKDAIGPLTWRPVYEMIQEGLKTAYQGWSKSAQQASYQRHATPYRFRGKRHRSNASKNNSTKRPKSAQ